MTTVSCASSGANPAPDRAPVAGRRAISSAPAPLSASGMRARFAQHRETFRLRCAAEQGDPATSRRVGRRPPPPSPSQAASRSSAGARRQGFDHQHGAGRLRGELGALGLAPVPGAADDAGVVGVDDLARRGRRFLRRTERHERLAARGQGQAQIPLDGVEIFAAAGQQVAQRHGVVEIDQRVDRPRPAGPRRPQQPLDRRSMARRLHPEAAVRLSPRRHRRVRGEIVPANRRRRLGGCRGQRRPAPSRRRAGCRCRWRRRRRSAPPGRARETAPRR